MNVYDFDHTIYPGDSTLDFYLFCLRNDLSLLRYLGLQSKAILRFALRKSDRTKMKEGFYSFLQGIENVDDCVEDFWRLHKKKIRSWYLERKTPEDVIVSASPEFLLLPLCAELGISLIASRVNPQNGECLSPNCRGIEKKHRFIEETGKTEIDEFYSDSQSDAPLASMAKKAYLVLGTRRRQMKKMPKNGGT